MPLVEPGLLAEEFIAIRSQGGLMTPPSSRYQSFDLPDGYAVGQ